MNEKPLQVEPFEVYFDHAIEDKELICELAKNSSVLYGLFVDLIRQYYIAGVGYIKGCPTVKFDYDKNKTDIWIDKEMRWEDEHPEFRPAIYVKLGKLQYQYPFNMWKTDIEPKTGTVFYTRLVQGTVSFVHLANTAGEANILCDNTARYLWAFSHQIADDYCLRKFQEIEHEALNKAPQASRDQWMSTCTFGFEFEETTAIRQEAPILQEIRIRPLQDKSSGVILRSELDKPRQGQGV